MITLSYLAYGSNLHPRRLIERIPSAKLVGVTEISGYELTFHKRSKDGSGKCNLAESGEADSSAFCAIYEIDAEEKPALDKAEGKGFGYLETQMSVKHNEAEYACFSYLAQRSHIVGHLKPYHWYKEMVVLGAWYLELPNHYIQTILSIQSEQDPDTERRRMNEALLERMREFR